MPDPPVGGAHRPAVPDDRRLALYGRHPHPAPLASSALHRAGRRLRRRHRLGVGDIQAAAEEAYDRTAACAFTSFVGYEYTASPLGRHLHRTIIFRNERVPPSVASYIETGAGGIPQGFWSAVEGTCLNAGTGCDAVVIPHNSNLSGGMQWAHPADATEALRRQTLEPLVELHQNKGHSECRFARLARARAGAGDGLCPFEQL